MQCAARQAPAPSASQAIIIHPLFAYQLQEQPLTPRGSFAEVPEEVLLRIASLMETARELATLERVCSRCRRAASADSLWRALCVDKFNFSGKEAVPSWRNMYRFNHQFLRKLLTKKHASLASGRLFAPGTQIRLMAPA